ncbi:serine-rich adhesin for platelets-like [Megalobrama amblycephala]|uniref:serine-rich adhesin for platelets-like n=1 Tax=Megalobrama amblycephala TaxID=75352 RepID=UPI00201410D1|nr:serine-rich adhesin for platelets-like [Megalobrama amblycephala]
MERLRPCLFIYLLAIWLSLSISSTTNSDHTNTEIFEWKGGDGVKRSRVRRHNLQLPDALSLPEKVYSMFILWRLLNDVSNDTNAIGISTMRPDKLESMSSEGPKNTEIVFKAKDKPSSAPTQEPSTHSTGITCTNDSFLASFPTDPSSPDSQKTTQSEDSQLIKQSTQRLQTTIQTIPEPSQVTEQYILDSTTLPIKNYSKAAEEPSSTIIHEQIDHFTGITNTKDPTAMTSFPTHSPDSQTTTQSGDSQLVNQSTQRLQTTIQTIPEPSQVTEQSILDSTTLPIKNYSKAAEEPSSTIIHEQIDHFTGITNTKDPTAMTSFPTHSPDSQTTTQSGDSQLVNQSTQRLQTTIQTIPEPSQVTEQSILDSTTLPIKNYSKAAEEPSSTIIHEQIDHFTGITNTKDPTAMTSFPTHSPDSQTTTQSGDSQLVNQSTQRLQTTIQTIPEPSQVTEQYILDSTTLPIKNYSKAAEEPSSTIIHEQIDHFTGITNTKDPTAMTSFPTHSPDSQTTTQSGDSQLVNQSTQRLQTRIQTIPEPSQVTEQHIPDSTTSTIKISSKAVEEPSTMIIQEQIDHFTGITNTKDPTAMTSFPTHSQTTTQSGDAQLVEESTIAKQKITEPSTVTEQHIPHSKTFTIQISSDITHEEISHSTGTTDSTAITSFSTELPPQESQNNTQSGAPRLLTQHLQRSKLNISEPSQVTEQHILDSTTLPIKNYSKAAEEPSSTIIHEQIDHFTGFTDTKDPTAMTSFPTHSPDSQTTTQSGDSQLVEESTITKQKITEPGQVTEQHIPDSKTLTIKIFSEAAEKHSSTIIHEQIEHFTGITDTKDPTAVTSFPTHSPDSQTTTQSGDSQLVEESTITKQKITEPSQVTEQHIPDSKTFTIQISSDITHEEISHSTGTTDSTAITSFSTELPPQESQNNTQSGAPRLLTQHLQRSKLNISEPSQVTEQHILDSTTLPIKNYSKAAEEPSSTIIHEQIDHFTGITDTKDSTAMTSFPTHSADSQTTTQSGDAQLVEESTIAKQKIMEPSTVMEQHILHSKTFTIKIPSKTVEETSLDIMHEESTRSTVTNDSTAITSFHLELPPQESQNNTQSGAPQRLNQSTHFQSTNSPTIPKPSQEFLQPTAVMFTPDMTTTYRNEKETPLQTAINSHITNHGILASTRGNDSLQPTSLPQTMKHEHPRRAITGMVKGISKPTLPAKTKNPTLSSSSIKLEILETATYTHSGTWHNGKPNQFVKATDWRVSKPTPPAFTLKEQTKDFTSLLLPETSISHLIGFTSDSERHKPTPAEEPRNHNTEQNAINTSNGGLMHHFLTTKTRILTNDLSVSSETASISPLLSLTEDHLVDSKGPGDTSVSKDISLHVSTSSAAPFTTYQMNPKTQSQSTTNKFPNLGTIISHTSVLLAKDTSTQAPTDKVRLSQTIPASTEKLTVTFTPNPKPSEKHIHTTSVVRRGFLTLITQEIPSWISTKQSNLLPIETTEPRSDLTNQEPTANTVAKEKYPNNDNDLLTEVDKSTQSTTGRKLSKTTRTATTKLHMSKTQKVSRNPKKFILPTHKSADTAIKDDTETHRGIFGLLFTFACLLLLIIVILLWVVWRRWQARRWRHNMWVAGPPLLCGTYHSVLQSSSTHTAIEMRKGNTQKNKQENSDVHERIALKQQHKDFQ